MDSGWREGKGSSVQVTFVGKGSPVASFLEKALLAQVSGLFLSTKMSRLSSIVNLCIALCVFVCKVELTPIVTLPPDNVITSSTERVALFSTSSDATAVSESIYSVPNTTGKGFAVKLGEHETVSTKMVFDTTTAASNESSITTTATVTQPVTRSDILNNNETEEEATTPELIIKTESSTAPTNNPELAQQTVTSQVVTLKGETEKPTEETTSETSPPDHPTTVSLPERVNVNNGESNDTGGDYKDKAPSAFHPYIEEILSKFAT